MSEPKPQNLSALDFFKFDIRVGTILTIEEVPKSKKLVKLEVSFGSEVGNRTIMAGVKAANPFVGQRVVAVLNLEPREMMGVVSNGMLLAASGPDLNGETHLNLLNPGQVVDGIEVG